jgi:putative ABC transport system substrate-binding protein
MRRRDFIKRIAGSAIAWPLAARAQQTEQARRIGVLMNLAANDPEGQARIAAFRQALQMLGWDEGRNARIDYRWTGGALDRMRAYAAELVGLRPNVIFATNSLTLEAVRDQTNTTPIVFVQIVDPVTSGYVASLAHPGGNITGFTNFERPIIGKWMGLLKEIAPRANRVAAMYDPDNPSWRANFPEIKAAALQLKMESISAAVRNAPEIEQAIDALAREPNGCLLVLADNTTAVHRKLITSLAIRDRVPAIYPFRFFVIDGGLMSYAIDEIDMFRRAASYVDRILKGAKPADLPIQAPTKFELIINLKTAKDLGLTVPASFVASADEVIE